MPSIALENEMSSRRHNRPLHVRISFPCSSSPRQLRSRTFSPTAATASIATSCSFSPTHAISIGASSHTRRSPHSSSTSASASSAFRSSVCACSRFSRRHDRPRQRPHGARPRRQPSGSGHGRTRPSRSLPCRFLRPPSFNTPSFDLLWWVLIAWFVIRLLKSENPRWWLAIGAAVGLGLLTKYSIVFYIAGILAGVVLTPARRFLQISLVLGRNRPRPPDLLCPTFSGSSATTSSPTRFLQHIHARDVGEGRAEGFPQGPVSRLHQPLGLRRCGSPAWSHSCASRATA